MYVLQCVQHGLCCQVQAVTLACTASTAKARAYLLMTGRASESTAQSVASGVNRKLELRTCGLPRLLDAISL